MKSVHQNRVQQQLSVTDTKGLDMPNEQENDSYVSKCVHIEEPLNMLQIYAKDLRGMVRKKREARETLEKMKYHARNLVFMLGKFDEFLQ